MKRQLLYIAAAVMLCAGPAISQTTSNASDAASIAAVAVESPQQFVDMATVSNMFEIQSSQVALEKSEQEDVRTFAQHMVDDHTKAAEDMKAAAEADGMTSVPTELDEKHQGMMDQLNAASGEEFDQLYTQMQVQAHEEAVGLFKGFSQSGGDSQLQAFAEATLPTLEEHYAETQELQE
jgi:putative membrane protein